MVYVSGQLTFGYNRMTSVIIEDNESHIRVFITCLHFYAVQVQCDLFVHKDQWPQTYALINVCWHLARIHPLFPDMSYRLSFVGYMHTRIREYTSTSQIVLIFSFYGFVTNRRQRYGEVMYHKILFERPRSQEMKSQKWRRLVDSFLRQLSSLFSFFPTAKSFQRYR